MVDRNAAVAGIAGFFLANFAVAAAWCWRRAPKTKSGHRNFDENHTPDIVSGCRQVKYANEVVLSLGSAVDTFGQKSASPGRTMAAILCRRRMMGRSPPSHLTISSSRSRLLFRFLGAGEMRPQLTAA